MGQISSCIQKSYMIYLKCGGTMKKTLKIIGKTIGIAAIGIYAVVAIILTICLLKYNDYNITEFKDKSLIIVSDDELRPDFNEGDLVVVYKNKNSDINVGDKIFFYDTYQNQVSVNLGSVINKETITKDETTFIMDGEYSLSSEYVIGAAKTSKVYPNMGKILGFLESRYGFLFIIIFPILIMFIYEIYAVIKEVKSKDDEI